MNLDPEVQWQAWQSEAQQASVRIAELEAELAEAREYLESHTNALHAAEARIADVIALCDRIDDGLRPGWPSTAFRAAATGDQHA